VLPSSRCGRHAASECPQRYRPGIRACDAVGSRRHPRHAHRCIAGPRERHGSVPSTRFSRGYDGESAQTAGRVRRRADAGAGAGPSRSARFRARATLPAVWMTRGEPLGPRGNQPLMRASACRSRRDPLTRLGGVRAAPVRRAERTAGDEVAVPSPGRLQLREMPARRGVGSPTQGRIPAATLGDRSTSGTASAIAQPLCMTGERAHGRGKRRLPGPEWAAAGQTTPAD
jgi:hypothetical protein